jgi:hypothetical protein
MSAVELAIYTHAIRVIATNNYRHCIRAIWGGYYMIQYDDEVPCLSANMGTSSHDAGLIDLIISIPSE